MLVAKVVCKLGETVMVDWKEGLVGGDFFFFSSRRRHTRLQGDWSSDVCSSDLFSSEEDVAITWAPAAFANCSANSETLPVPRISTVSPGLTLPYTTKALQAVTPEIGRASCRERV